MYAAYTFVKIRAICVKQVVLVLLSKYHIALPKRRTDNAVLGTSKTSQVSGEKAIGNVNPNVLVPPDKKNSYIMPSPVYIASQKSYKTFFIL